jgi:hypothetical protein
MGRTRGRRPSFLSFERPDSLTCQPRLSIYEQCVPFFDLVNVRPMSLCTNPTFYGNIIRTCVRNSALLTLSDPPVAPSISSMITSTGLVPPTAVPVSSTGLIRSSMVLPVRASLLDCQIPRLRTDAMNGPCIDLHDRISGLSGYHMGQGSLSETRRARKQ